MHSRTAPSPPRSQLHNCTCDVHVLRSHKLLHEFEIFQYLEKKKQTEVRLLTAVHRLGELTVGAGAGLDLSAVLFLRR
jgi:hypothetical protein